MDKKPRPTLHDIRPRSMDPVRPPRPVKQEASVMEPITVEDKLDKLQSKPAKPKSRLKKFVFRLLVLLLFAAIAAAAFWFYIKPTYIDF